MARIHQGSSLSFIRLVGLVIGASRPFKGFAAGSSSWKPCNQRFPDLILMPWSRNFTEIGFMMSVTGEHTASKAAFVGQSGIICCRRHVAKVPTAALKGTQESQGRRPRPWKGKVVSQGSRVLEDAPNQPSKRLEGVETLQPTVS